MTSLSRDKNGIPIQALSPISAVSVALSGTSQALAVPADTSMIRIAATGNAWIAFGTSSISRGTVVVSPSGITSGEAFGTATVSNGSLIIIPTGISSGEVFGLPTVQPGTIVVVPSGIASAEGFGTATMLVGELIVYASGIPSGNVFGIPNVTGGVSSTATAVLFVRGFSSYGFRRNS